MAISITAYQRRTTRETITFRNSSNAVATLGASDVVRVKIGRSGGPQETPLLDIKSGSFLAGGSYVTAVNPVTLVLCGDDLVPNTIQPGIYDIEANVVDAADAGRIKLAEQGTFFLHPSQGGNIT